jgi:hypothetical protein
MLHFTSFFLKYKSCFLVKENLLLLNATFAMPVLEFILRVDLE